MIVVSDTSPICYLLLIDQIMILQELYKLVVIPEAVADGTFWANAVRPYIVDKIRYCRGAKLAPSDRLGYYSHASP